jgi:hypothetical protein
LAAFTSALVTTAAMAAPETVKKHDLLASRYGALDASSCTVELKRRGVPFVSVDAARGVRAPVRLTGPIRGVLFRTELGPAARAVSPYEIVDCRLALALDDMTRFLPRYGIVEVRHYSMYRPPSKRWKGEAEAKRHPGGLAIDVGRFKLADGAWVEVERDFHSRIGGTTCGVNATLIEPTPETMRLRTLVCELAEAGLFHFMLTPSYNWPHRNHLHLEVAARYAGQMVR